MNKQEVKYVVGVLHDVTLRKGDVVLIAQNSKNKNDAMYVGVTFFVLITADADACKLGLLFLMLHFCPGC